MDTKSGYPLRSLPSTPPTRIISDEELPYYEDPPSSDSSTRIKSSESDFHDMSEPHPVAHSSPRPIELKELPADRIDSPQLRSKGSVLTTFWEYLTLYWRN